jgi:hypothetical protein
VVHQEPPDHLEQVVLQEHQVHQDLLEHLVHQDHLDHLELLGLLELPELLDRMVFQPDKYTTLTKVKIQMFQVIK